MKPGDQQRVADNLFPEARGGISDWETFPWHRHREQITTWEIQSSQALAIDLFGTLKTRIPPERNVLLARLAAELAIPGNGEWDVDLEVAVEEKLLNEPRQTQLDAIARSEHAVITIECKFTEHGGACSQVLPPKSGGPPQCNGNYRLQRNPHNGKEARCALAAKGIRYWEYVPRVFDLDATVDHAPCPFSGEWFQWMRNVVAAQAMAAETNPPRAAATLVVYADAPGLPAAESDWSTFRRALRSNVRFGIISYQRLIMMFREAARAARLPGTHWEELDAWVRRKIARVTDTR